MNHIAQTWSAKISGKSSRSPTCERILHAEDRSTATTIDCGSWRSRMLAKVKECRDAIKNMMAADRLSNGKSAVDTSILFERATASVSSIPDIITFSSIAFKHKDHENEDEVILTRNSTLNTDELEKSNANDSPSSFPSANDTASSSLRSFVALEKQLKAEFRDEDNAFTMIKKKISAEPFLSYTEGTAEFVWSDDTTEDSFSAKAWNSLEHLNSTDIGGFGRPRTNSTFCENSSVGKRNRTSSPIRGSGFEDSGFENNFSI